MHRLFSSLILAALAADPEPVEPSCEEQLQESQAKLQQSVDAAAESKKARDRVCAATAAFADELTRGRSAGAKETGCVNPTVQARLDPLVAGWVSASAFLGQVTAYENGETEVFPRRPGGLPAFQRHLLIDVLRLIAPQAWATIQAGGVEAWFGASAPLEAELVEEARHSPAAPGPGSPPLTAALHLVRAFELSAQCEAPLARECGRAHQLREMLESTGSLVVRRRVQEIWAAECSSVSSETTAAWIADFPRAQVAGAADPWSEIEDNAFTKLFACYLDDPTKQRPFGPWLVDALPPPATSTAERLARVDGIRARWDDGAPEAACARAVRAMQTMTPPATCAMPGGELPAALAGWAAARSAASKATAALGMCSQLAQLLWEGKAASIAGSFARPPSLDTMVAAYAAPPTPMARLRAHCDERRGAAPAFPGDLATLAGFARSFGEGVDRPPFRVDPASLRPTEDVRLDAASTRAAWLEHVVHGQTACTALGLADARCGVCAEVSSHALYDCALVHQLDDAWSARTRHGLGAILGFALLVLLGTWARRWRSARRAFGAWEREATALMDNIGLAVRVDPLRHLVPGRHDTLRLALPPEGAWQRWGLEAALIRAPSGSRVTERDVNHAAFVARRLGVSVVLLEHDDGASPDMSAVRATLEWAGRGGARAVQVLPIGAGRLRWCKSAQDILELVEESSLRGNPFDLRGRVASSMQFFNRERLVSGLLASAQAGHWTLVTGLRRFGKSSLALETARRLPGAAAYVDLAGFDEEILHATNASAAATSILRYACLRLVEAVRARLPDATLPPPPPDDKPIDVAFLTLWLRDLSRASAPMPLLVVIDELEQIFTGDPDRVARALEILAIVIGRLKSAVGDAAMPDGGTPLGVFLASAIHPLLWAPLRALAHQSIIGSFQRVCLPCLDDDAATTMMRSLGARQGIRFTDAALQRIVTESQGVPLLLRRLGGSILELYDADRARQGSLGAVEIGVEGAREATERETREGSPLRVWIETEIAERAGVAGMLLRRLAERETVDAAELTRLATDHIAADFEKTGISSRFSKEELSRRSEEAGHVIVQLLEESGLVVAHGDLTAPSAYALPDGVIRRVLAR